MGPKFLASVFVFASFMIFPIKTRSKLFIFSKNNISWERKKEKLFNE